VTAARAAGRRDLAALPKAHLHLHFEAAVRRETLAELAEASGTPAPHLPDGGGFDDFAQAFLGLTALLSVPGALTRAVHEMAEDAAADGVVYLELGVSPQFYATDGRTTSEVLAELVEAASDARTRTGVQIGLMVTFDRTEPVESAMELARLAVAHAGRGVTAVGLANNEAGHPAAPFLPAFELARAAGLMVTPHAGELAGPESVIEALDVLHADRIQHGIRAVEDRALLARLSETVVCLDVCPTSNVALGIVPNLGEHPLSTLLDAGVRCSIGADDPTIFGVGLVQEYENARDRIGLSDEQLASCARASIEFCSADAEVRIAARARIDEWLAGQP
jgi:adenosine deaminase